MTEPDEVIPLELLANTVVRLKAMPEHQIKSLQKLVDEAYQLLQFCRDQLKVQREQEQMNIAFSHRVQEVLKEERIPYDEALDQILGDKNNKHYRKRFEKFVLHATDALVRSVASDFDQGVPVSWVSSLRRDFLVWNKDQTQKSKVQNPQKKRKLKNFP